MGLQLNKPSLTIALRARKQDAGLVLGDVIFIDGVEIVSVLSVVPAGDENLLLLPCNQVGAAEGINFWQLLSLWLEQFPSGLLWVELEDLV